MLRHKTALEHAQKALAIARACSDITGPDHAKINVGATMAIAFYNVGAELEHLRLYREAYASCRQGLQICGKLLGADHTLCIKLAESLVEIEKSKQVSNFP